MRRSRLKERLPAPARRLVRGVRGVVARRSDQGPGAPWALERARAPAQLGGGPATDRLFARLDRDDIEAVEARLSRAERELAGAGDEVDRRRVLLAMGLHHAVPEVADKTGLSAASPPDEVHAMGRGPLATGGTSYYADIVAEAAGRAGVELDEGKRALDFGCSSGRVVRVLAAAYPDVEWHACDPNAGAIAWARTELPGIRFEVGPQAPPLPQPDSYFDLVFAISVWSHFAAPAAMRWLAEMQRVIRPGGALVITTHGYQSVAHAHAVRQRSEEQLTAILAALYRDGHWYKPEFGACGDHGVASPDWGTAFLTSEWMLAAVAPHWRMEHFAPGLVEADQDLYVLSRR